MAGPRLHEDHVRLSSPCLDGAERLGSCQWPGHDAGIGGQPDEPQHTHPRQGERVTRGRRRRQPSSRRPILGDAALAT